MTMACMEYVLESAFLPSSKQFWPLIALGTLGVAFGEFFRKGAMVCAAHNFTHQVRNRAADPPFFCFPTQFPSSRVILLQLTNPSRSWTSIGRAIGW